MSNVEPANTMQLATDELSVKHLPFHGKDRAVFGYSDDALFRSLVPGTIDSVDPGGYGGFDDFCRRYLRKNYVMIDVGANIGITSLIAGDYLSEGRMICIDASPRNCAALEKCLNSNGFENAIIVPVAVGSALGELQFNEAGAYGHVLTESVALGRSGITVNVKTIDQIVSELGLDRIDFIKIDVEGFERDVIQGASEVIKKWNPLFYIEFNSWCQIAVHNESPLVFYDFLLDNFKSVYKIKDGDLILLKKGEGLHFLHENIISRGCVEDVVACTTNERLIESPTYLADRVNRLNAERDTLRTQRDAALAECDQLRVERDRVINKLGRIKHSLYWRASQPFRKLSKKLK